MKAGMSPLYIEGVEWIIVIALIVVLLIWGPEKIPKLARSFGQAKREFEKASKEAEATVEEIAKTSSDPVLELAHQLGIETKGMTKEEILAEIRKVTKK